MGVAQCGRELFVGIARGLGQLERLEDRAPDEPGIPQRRERRDRGAVPELGGEAADELQREPRLPDPADPGQRQQPRPVVADERRQRVELAFASESRRRRRRNSACD